MDSTDFKNDIEVIEDHTDYLFMEQPQYITLANNTRTGDKPVINKKEHTRNKSTITIKPEQPVSISTHLFMTSVAVLGIFVFYRIMTKK